MSAELIGILSIGAAVGGLVLQLQSRTDKRRDGLEGELRQLGERMARLEGLIKGSGLFRPAHAPALTLSSEDGPSLGGVTILRCQDGPAEPPPDSTVVPGSCGGIS